MVQFRILLVQPGKSEGSLSFEPSSTHVPAPFHFLASISEVSAPSLFSSAPDVVVVIQAGDRATSIRAVRDVRALCAQLPIVFVAAESCETLVIDAFHSGVTRFLKYPWTDHQLFAEIREVTERSPFTSPKRDVDPNLNSTCPLVGTGPAICELRRYISQIAPSDTNVLITGETGTGKELVARLIHENSARRSGPFVCLNSAAIPESLVESELFGYEKGAFTGAHVTYQGKLAAANFGTAFLDEIGDISPAVQAKILRAVEDKTIYRLGNSHGQDLNVRILAATNQDLEWATKQNRFRSDLYYRLNVLRVEIPPLRDRVEDLPPLVDYYIRQFNARFGRNIKGFRPASLDLLTSYSWPGNVRELRNLIEAAFVNLPPAEEGLVDLPFVVFRQFSRSKPFQTSERTNLLRVLSATNWNKSDAAKALHCSRMTLYRKINRHKVSCRPPDSVQ